MNSFRAICPNLRCRKTLDIPEPARGKVVRCVNCQTTFRAPEKPTPGKHTQRVTTR